jgi:hypothetical protein
MPHETQRRKQCAFNLYTAAMLEHALAPMCRAFGENPPAAAALDLSRKLRDATVKKFWSPEHGIFVNNLPWLAEEKKVRLCDRSLATAILFEQCPRGDTSATIRALAECPPEMGFSYPANAGWRLRALAKAGRTDVVVKDLRERWATMDSVRLNNTLQESWKTRPDSGAQWSHCPVAPLYIAYQSLAGLRPLEPGFRRVEVRPQPADLEHLELVAHTVRGPLHFSTHGKLGARELTVELPPDCAGELILHREEKVLLERATDSPPSGHRRYQIPAGKSVTLQLSFT